MESDVLEMPGKPQASRKAIVWTTIFWFAVLGFFLVPAVNRHLPSLHTARFTYFARGLMLLVDIASPTLWWKSKGSRSAQGAPNVVMGIAFLVYLNVVSFVPHRPPIVSDCLTLMILVLSCWIIYRYWTDAAKE